MKKILILSVLAFAFFSCGICNSKKNDIPEEKETIEQPKAVDTHGSQNSLDYGGVYKGTIPCADCGGIEVEITLDYEGNYIKRTVYTDKEPDNVFTSEGTYKWNEQGNKITLTSESEPNMYLVGENRLIMLDKDGNRITGTSADKYILEQTEKLYENLTQ